MIIIPDVKGKSLRETKNKFDDWGLRYDQVKETYSFNTEKGKVVRTEPAIGSKVNYGDLITVYVSKGKTYPIFIVVFAFLLIGLLLGKGTISRIIEDSKKKPQTANVCLINCDTNGDGIADTNLDTDGDGVCDTNCDGEVSQDGNGNSTDGKKNENPKEDKKKNQETPAPTVKVVTEKQGTNTVVKVVESKNTDVIKYENGNKKIEYFTSGNGQTIAIGEYVIIGNTGTITIYAGNGSGGGTTTQVGGDTSVGDDPFPQFSYEVPQGYSNDPYVRIDAESSVYALKIIKGDQEEEVVKTRGKEITGKDIYYLCSNANPKNEAACTGTWTLGAWSKGGRYHSETITFNKYDATKPTFTINGDLLTSKQTVSVVIDAKDLPITNYSNDYFKIYYTLYDGEGSLSDEELDNMAICTGSTIDNCKMRLTNGEHLGIRQNGKYQFIVYDKAGNYQTQFANNDDRVVTINNVRSETLSVPTFILNNYDWSTSKEVTISYPTEFDGVYEYSIDGGNTWINSTSGTSVTFNDDGKETHEVIARVKDGENTVTSSSIVITKIDNANPVFTLGLEDNGSFGLSSDMELPKSSNKNSLKSGATTSCKVKKHNEEFNDDYFFKRCGVGQEPDKDNCTNDTLITNISEIDTVGYYDFKCSMISGSGKKAATQTVTNVEVFQPRYITFHSNGAKFDKNVCEDKDYKCESNDEVAVKNIHEGDMIKSAPRISKDGYNFDGWYLLDGKTETDSAINTDDIPSTNQDYYAKWSLGNFTITFDANGGTINNKESIDKDVQNGSSLQFIFGSLAQPIKNTSDEMFGGWYDDPKGGNLITGSYVPSSSFVAYAHWISNVGSDFVSYITQLYNSGAYSSVLSGFDGKNIRYVSASANNYVDIDGNGLADYRIIGVIKVQKANGTETNLIKLLSINSIGRYVVNSDVALFGQTTLKSTLQSLPVSQYAENVRWTTNPLTTQLKSTTVADALNLEYQYTNYYEGKVGLLHISDIAYSSSSQSNPKLNKTLPYSYSWMMSGNNHLSNATYVLDAFERDDYSLLGPYLAYGGDNGYKIEDQIPITLDLDIYPVIYLKDGTKINGGNGTQANPFGIMNN